VSNFIFQDTLLQRKISAPLETAEKEIKPPDTSKPKQAEKPSVTPDTAKATVQKKKEKESKKKKEKVKERTREEATEKAVVSSETKDSLESAPVRVPVEAHSTSFTRTEQTPVDTIFTEKSLFTGHLLKQKHDWPQLRNQRNGDWFVYAVLAVLGLFAIVTTFYRKRFRQLTDAFFTSRIAGQLAREENVLQQRLTIILFIIFLLISGAFLYQLSQIENIIFFQGSPLTYYLLIVGALFSAYVVKLLSVKVLGSIFKVEKESSEYIFNLILFNNVLGLVLFPCVVTLAFVPAADPSMVIKVAVILSVFLFAVRTFRGLVIGTSGAGISKFYLFIYLCTLEILPLVVIIKLLVSRL
jgi:hypothetical protein